MNRRSFFSNLFSGIVATGVAPSIIIPKLADRHLWKRQNNIIVPRKLKCVWTVEMEQDLECYYNIDAESELVRYMNQHIQNEIDRGIITKLNKMYE